MKFTQLELAEIRTELEPKLKEMKCPYCGCSLVGYRPIPKECPKCHKKFEE